VRRQQNDLIYRAEYEPDMARMVRALRVLLDFDPSDSEKRLYKKEMKHRNKNTDPKNE